MNKNTVYILQKDLPNAKAGDKYESTDSGENYINLNAMATWDVSYPKEYIENNSDWFVKEEVNESKPTEKKQWEDEDDDFLWTNELVMEFVNFHDEQKGIHWLSEDIEKFKKSKSKKEEPQWEILEFKNLRSGIVYIKKDNGKFNSGNGLDWDLEKFDIKDHEIINSVKRFPDNTVWSVDDDTQHGKISGFKIAGSTMIAEIKNTVFPYDYPLYLSELKAPKEEQVPIKVEIMEFGYGKPQENKGNFYVANFNLPNNAKLPTEKYQSIKSAIEDVLNEDKIKHEKLLSKIESKVRLANMINTQANYLKETLDYINSLK